MIIGLGGLLLTALPMHAQTEVSATDSAQDLPSAEETQINQTPDELRKQWLQAEAAGKDTEARKWNSLYVNRLEQLAGQGDVSAMVNLGKFFTMGSVSFPRNEETAHHWFLKAAEAGDLNSCYHLASMYQRGLGCAADEKAAHEWYRTALAGYVREADKGNPEAAFWVGIMCEKGLGTEKDRKSALHWLGVASDGNYADAQYLLGIILKEEHQEEASRQRLLQAANQGHPGAMLEVATDASREGASEDDSKLARHWFTQLAEKKNAYAIRRLADMLAQGQGGEVDLPQARAYYIQAASYGDPEAAKSAALMLESGEGGAVDVDQARRILTASADQFQSVQGQYELGQFEARFGNDETALHWVKLAAEAGYVPAMTQMGVWHVMPFSPTSWNPVAAWKWWDYASSRGDTLARTYSAWLVWGGGGLLLVIIIAFLLWMNRFVNKRFAAEDAQEKLSK